MRTEPCSAANKVTIVGGGLAGCEAALTLAQRGIAVRLVDQKPESRTAAQHSDSLCELVCSNSFRGAALANAVGLLKAEMRSAGSFVMRAAELTSVPAGGALAVDRREFAQLMTSWIADNALIERVVDRVAVLPNERPLVIATGPLTGESLALDIQQRVGVGRLFYYDAIAPVVAAESIDWSQVFQASRWSKGDSPEAQNAYVNCPMSAEQYESFIDALLGARRVEPHDFEKAVFFEGCLPVEVMAERGRRTLAFGPMKPVGLTDPRTGRRPHAVVQLRREDATGTFYNLVGFQTRLAQSEQKRVLRMIPGLERAEFSRYGAVHRNTFLDSPRLLDETLRLRAEKGVYFAGQITGVEGYVESAASGLLCARFVAAHWAGREPRLPPATTALGGLLAHLRRADGAFQPSNITFGHLEPWSGSRLRKRARYEAMAHRALADLQSWMQDVEGEAPLQS